MKKAALIFNINQHAKDPIIVIKPDIIPGGISDNEYPLLAFYDGVHYESVYPISYNDRELTKMVVAEFPEYKGDNFKNYFKELIKKDPMEVSPPSVKQMDRQGKMFKTAQESNQKLDEDMYYGIQILFKDRQNIVNKGKSGSVELILRNRFVFEQENKKKMFEKMPAETKEVSKTNIIM